MKLLFTTPILEHPPAGGPSLRIETSIKALARRTELHVVSRCPKSLMGGETGELHVRGLCRAFTYAPSVEGLSANRYLRKAQRIYRKLMRLDDDARYLIDYADRQGISVIWFGFGNISFPLIKRIKELRPEIKTICDTDSVWSRYVLRELPYEENPARRAKIERTGRQKELEERQWVDLCEVTTAVSEVDAEYYASLATDPRRILHFSNVLDLDAYRERPVPPAALKTPNIYLAGSFIPQGPMDKAARWVIDEVLPLVREKVPDVHFYIIGARSKTTLADISDPNITILGKVPSVLPYLCNSNVALVPLKFESGTRFKILEAGACGIPVVSTVLGAEGIPVTNGEDILLEDDARAFADATVKLLQDPALARKLGDNLRSLVTERYGVDRLEREVRRILERLHAA